MATDTYQESLLWNDGEGITHEDLNDMQRLGERRLVDVFGRPLYLDPGDDGVATLRPVGRALSLHKDISPNMKVFVQPGVVLQKQTPDPGQPEPHHLMHLLESAVEFELSDGDATDPRIDLISAKVEYDAVDPNTGTNPDAVQRDFQDAVTRALTTQIFDKRRRTLLTLTLTQGTAAPSPVEPTPPAGEVVIHRIDVPALATSLTSDQFTDRRTPAGYTSWQVTLASFVNGPGSSWSLTISPNMEWSLAGGAAGHALDVTITPPHHSVGALVGSAGQHAFKERHLRLAAARLNYNLSASSFFAFKSGDAIDGSGDTTRLDLSSQLSLSGTNQSTQFSFNLDNPLWINGLASPTDESSHQEGQLKARVIGQSTADRVRALYLEFWGF